MTLRLNGSTSGYTEIDAPAVAGSNTLVLPSGNGSDGNILGTDGAGNLSWVNRSRTVLETAGVAPTGDVDYTGFPSSVRRITVMFDQVSTNGTGGPYIQLMTSSGVISSGYSGYTAAGINSYNSINGVVVDVVGQWTANDSLHGTVYIHNVTGNTWIFNGLVARNTVSVTLHYTVTLPDILTGVRVGTWSTSTYDAGTFNVLYEG